LAAFRLDPVLADEPASSTLPIEAFNRLLSECALAFCPETKLAATLKRRFLPSLHDAPALLPTTNTALRRSQDKWFLAEGIRPRLIAECEDAALMAVMALDGLGFFPMPTVVAKEAAARLGLQILGHAESGQQQFYTITTERSWLIQPSWQLTSRARTALSG